jgi:hypothetical protein
MRAMSAPDFGIPIRPRRVPVLRAAVAGLFLCVLGAVELVRPLGERPALGYLALAAGTLFVLLALFLRATRGPTDVWVEGGHVLLREGEEDTRIPLGPIRDALLVDAPLGQEHPLLYLVSARGGVLELVTVAGDHAEAARAAMAEAAGASAASGVEVTGRGLQAEPDTVCWQRHRVAFDGEDLVVELHGAAPRRIPIAEVTAIDFVAQLHPQGAGLASTPAQLMRRAAAGLRLPASSLSRGAALALALWLESELARRRA